MNNLHNWDEYWASWEEARLEPWEKVEELADKLGQESPALLKEETGQAMARLEEVCLELQRIVDDKRHGKAVRAKLQDVLDSM